MYNRKPFILSHPVAVMCTTVCYSVISRAGGGPLLVGSQQCVLSPLCALQRYPTVHQCVFKSHISYDYVSGPLI